MEKIIGLCTEKADLDAFRSFARGFDFAIMGTRPAEREWRGVGAMKRHFDAVKDNFTEKFQFTTDRQL